MNSKIIEIVYLATGSYRQFAETFFNTLYLFFPGYKKIITIVSDGLEDYEKYSSEDILEINYHKILQLPYPFVSYFKFNYIKEYNSGKADYIFYFDADTQFIQNDNIDFDNILKLADSNVLLSMHPFYAFKDDYESVNTLYEYNTERDSRYCSYIGLNQYDYVIGSICGGSKENMLKLCDKIISMMTADLKHPDRKWYIPKFMDETYLNSISLTDTDLNYVKEQFCVMYEWYEFTNFTFCWQKGFPIEKEERIND